jgi:prepilin-type N-terminal cleavage/methylation domain-containing protein
MIGQNAKRRKFSFGFTLIESLVVFIIIGILSSVVLSSFVKFVSHARCISKGDIKGLCFPRKERSLACNTQVKSCRFPRLKISDIDQYRPPKRYQRINGFYVRILDPQASAKVVYRAYHCSNHDKILKGEHIVSTEFNDDRDLALRLNYISFGGNYCSFKFRLDDPRHPNSEEVRFISNFSVE